MESSVNAKLPEMTGHSVLYSKWNGFRGEMENKLSSVCVVLKPMDLIIKNLLKPTDNLFVDIIQLIHPISLNKIYREKSIPTLQKQNS